jgi:hypothetical protein
MKSFEKNYKKNVCSLQTFEIVCGLLQWTKFGVLEIFCDYAFL